MASQKKRKKGKKIRLKHPEVYAYLFFIGLIMYTILVIDLYRTKRTRVVSKQSQPLYNPLTLVSRTQIQTLIPDEDEAVIYAPNVSHVTSDSVVIFVQSDYGNTERRHRIRHTWANGRYYRNNNNNNNNKNSEMERNIVVLFAVGTSGESGEESGEDDESILDQEMSEHNDILLLNVVDAYDSLTVKGLLAMTWIHRNLKRVNYVIKTDDDVLLNMPGWLSAIRSLEEHNASCVMAGFVWTNPQVIRSGKYRVDKAAYGPDLFPAFCSGAAYVMSRDSMAAVLEASSYIPLLVRDDPYYTGILAQAMGISLLSFPKETLVFEESLSVDRLNARAVMAVHRLTSREWYKSWHVLMSRRRQKHRHRVRLRTVYPEEGGLRLTRLSKALNKTLQNECLSETIFGDVILV